MNPVRKIRIVAVLLILTFGLGAVASIAARFAPQALPVSFFAIVVNLAFVIGGVGLFKLKRWSWLLTIALCALSIFHFLWHLFSTLTPETATQTAEIASYIVVGLYLAIAFFLTSDAVRPIFRKNTVLPPL